MDLASILKFHTNPDSIEAAVSLSLAAHRPFVDRMRDLIAFEEYRGEREDEISALRRENERLRVHLAQMQVAWPHCPSPTLPTIPTMVPPQGERGNY